MFLALFRDESDSCMIRRNCAVTFLISLMAISLQSSASALSASTSLLMNKRVIIIAGPNGAGENDLCSFVPAERGSMPAIHQCRPDRGRAFAIRAQDCCDQGGAVMLAEIAECVHNCESFAFETTLSGLSYLRHVKH